MEASMAEGTCGKTSRRFRALKLWLVLWCHGIEGLRGTVRAHVRMAAVFEAMVRADARFEVPMPRQLSLVCRPAGMYVLRCAIGNSLTEEQHVRAAWSIVQKEATAILAAAGDMHG
ncbi:tyrosine decarboxylase-like [Setaria viridis]|uniref:tyrosine decarboxylase-like n=1 Tax=Setaria viridis TaxID=4556 RepID=UPI003B3AD3E2